MEKAFSNTLIDEDNGKENEDNGKENEENGDDKKLVNELIKEVSKPTAENLEKGKNENQENKDWGGKTNENILKFFENKEKNNISAKETVKQTAKMVIGSVASIAGIKSFYDVPAYFRQRFSVRGNIMGMGKGKGMEGSIEELLAKSQKSHSEREDEEEKKEISFEKVKGKFQYKEGGTMEAIKDLDKRLAMTREGGEKNSEQRNLIAKLLRENRHLEHIKKDERHKKITTILDDYTTTKVTGVQATREAMNTALVGLAVSTGGASLRLRPLIYMPLSMIDKKNEMKKEARKKARKEGKTNIEITEAGESVNTLDAVREGIKETFEGATWKGEGTKKQKIFKAIKSYGNIARIAGITGTAFITQGAYGEAVDKFINALGEKETWSEAGNNFIEGSLSRLTLGLLKNDGGLEQITPTTPAETGDSLPATESPKIGEIETPPSSDFSYKGGNSVWKESENQLKSLLGEKNVDEKIINRMTQFVVREPEKYGLPENIDFNRMSAEEIENTNWGEAIAKATGNEPLPPAINLNLDEIEEVETPEEINTETEYESAEETPEETVAKTESRPMENPRNPDGTINTEYFKTGEGEKEMRRLNESIEKYFKSTHNRADLESRTYTFNELKEEIKQLENKINGKITYNRAGNIFLNREKIFDAKTANLDFAQAFDEESTGGSKLLEKITVDGKTFDPNSPRYLGKLTRHFNRQMDGFVESKNGQEQLKILSMAGKKYFDKSIPLEERQKIIASISDLRKNIEEKLHCSTNVTPEGDVQLLGFVTKEIKVESLFENPNDSDDPDNLLGPTNSSEEISIAENVDSPAETPTNELTSDEQTSFEEPASDNFSESSEVPQAPEELKPIDNISEQSAKIEPISPENMNEIRNERRGYNT